MWRRLNRKGFKNRCTLQAARKCKYSRKLKAKSRKQIQIHTVFNFNIGNWTFDILLFSVFPFSFFIFHFPEIGNFFGGGGAGVFRIFTHL